MLGIPYKKLRKLTYQGYVSQGDNLAMQMLIQYTLQEWRNVGQIRYNFTNKFGANFLISWEIWKGSGANSTNCRENVGNRSLYINFRFFPINVL